MARYLGPKGKLSRREGTDLFLKSARRSIQDKAKFDSKPGQHGRTSGQRTSDYGLQLREKQKVKRLYGLAERQFRGYYHKAIRMKGVAGENLLQLLERRLDNVIYRLGFASDHAEARQLVRHGHFLINGHKVDIPSFLCRSSDQIEVRDGSKKITRILESLGAVDRRGVPKWLELEKDNFKGKLTALPAREDLTLPIREQLIVELYSR